MRPHRLVVAVISIPLLTGALAGQALFTKPVKVLGDPNFIGTAANPTLADSTGPNWIEGREVNSPIGIALDNSVSPPIVYIADTGNNRVLAYQYTTQLTAGSAADLILGQQNQYTNLPQGPGRALSTGLNSPTGLAVDSAGNLYVADTGNNRILRYAKPFSQPAGYQFPNLIIGQTSFSGATSNPGGIKATTLALSGSFFGHTGLTFDASGNLWVTDTGNNRVLRFPVSVLTAGQNGPAADTVIGQKDFVSNTSPTSQTDLTHLLTPTSVTFDAVGNMLVADGGRRVVVYPPGSTTGNPATKYLGIAVPASNQPSAVQVGFVTGVIAQGTNILVVDAGNNRVLTFGAVSTWPTSGMQLSPAANLVTGQPDFMSSMSNQGGLPAANTLSGPIDLAASTSELFIADSGNNRVVVYPLNSFGPQPAASRVIGQLDFPYNAPNLVVGQEFFTALSATNFTNPSGSVILDYSSTPPHLYVADTYNNRILGFNDFTHAMKGQKADIVIGQPDLLHTAVNYPSNQGTVLNNTGLSGPTGMAVDSAGNLYVSDTFNSRILRFPAPFASGMTAGETADLVLGQSSFTSQVTDATASTLAEPIALAFTQEGFDATTNTGYLAVTDAAQNRVLLFQKPFTSGMSASVVLGQTYFTTKAASNGTAGMSAPFAVAVDPQDHIIVADTGNRRISVFDVVGNLQSGASPSFFLTRGISAPESIAMESSGQFWVADPGANAAYHFAAVAQLPLANYTSDASVPVVSPRSAFVDSYNNLVVGDGIDRILYFAPALGVVNSANYIKGRALAPGTLASIFPAVSTNVLATGTANNSGTFPLPTTLAGTQVIVNGTPSALLYVSPGQINLPLSMNLPTGGSVDLQVVSQATGQIFGGAELPLNSASPGLFAGAGGTGTGQVAAENQDSSINSATNPLLRGQVLQLFATGQGIVPNAPPDGQASTGPVPTSLHPQIILGGAFVPDANIQYSGLAPDLVGVWQINFTVPTTVTAGNAVPIAVIMNSVPSDNPATPGSIATTVALK